MLCYLPQIMDWDVDFQLSGKGSENQPKESDLRISAVSAEVAVLCMNS